MWSYYGSKFKLAGLYPKPKYSLIIEPFAGAAWYSITHRNHEVLLNDKYKVVYDIWKWLIEDATPQYVLEHKSFYYSQDIRKMELTKPYQDLVGFCINRGSTEPKNIVTRWSCQSKLQPDFASTVEFSLRRVARFIPEIKHWKVQCGDYFDLPDVEATWFIDPPYQKMGHLYKENHIDYSRLSDWCRSRKGQVIVCEGDDADWLDFRPLYTNTGQRKKSKEVVWIRS